MQVYANIQWLKTYSPFHFLAGFPTLITCDFEQGLWNAIALAAPNAQVMLLMSFIGNSDKGQNQRRVKIITCHGKW